MSILFECIIMFNYFPHILISKVQTQKILYFSTIYELWTFNIHNIVKFTKSQSLVYIISHVPAAIKGDPIF